MTNVTKVAVALSLSAITLSASGYRIPEQSLNSTALSGAYVAGANGADASYYNPANMAFMNDGSSLESALTYINLPSVKYSDKQNSLYDGKSKKEQFIVPTFHYVSPKYGNFRYGLSLVAPAGLSKRWNDAYAKATAKEFTLKVFELNPTMSYMFSDKFAIGLGLRAVYSDGIVKSDATGLNPSGPKRNMQGDSFDFGYNLALSYKPTPELTLASTYRSKVDLTIKGDADLSIAGGLISYSGGASVMIPLPASLTLAANYDFGKTNVEFVYERTYWSSYKDLDFGYSSPIHPALVPYFGVPKEKNWSDSDTYRIGVTHQYSDKLKLMAGYAYDESPAPDNTLGFELPDSDAQLYSCGFEYKLSDTMSIGMAYLFDKKKERTVDNRTITNQTAPSGTLKDSEAHLITASFKYKF
jgi:long-chain fatty acid transport protein